MKEKKDLLLVVTVMAISFVIAVIGYFILPDTLVTQITVSGEGSTLPKLMGLGLPLLISIITSAMYYKYKNITKYIISVIICAVMYLLIFIFNI